MSHSCSDYTDYDYDDAKTSVPSSRCSVSSSSHSRHSNRKLIIPPDRHEHHRDSHSVKSGEKSGEKKRSKRVSDFLAQQKQIDASMHEKYPRERRRKHDEVFVYGDPSEIVISSETHTVAVKSQAKFSIDLSSDKLTFHGNQHF